MTVNPLLPIIDELARATSHCQRAEWLLKCPPAILLSYEFTIRNRLQAAGFVEGERYLDCELSTLRAVRREGLICKANPLRADLLWLIRDTFRHATDL